MVSLQTFRYLQVKQARSLNQLVPRISVKQAGAPIAQFWKNASFADLSDEMNREIIAYLFNYAIYTLSTYILEAFCAENVLFANASEDLCVSEETITNQLFNNLQKCFILEFGQRELSSSILGELVTLICKEITNKVNSMLHLCRVQDNRLVKFDESGYFIPIESIEIMLRCVQALKRILEQVGPKENRSKRKEREEFRPKRRPCKYIRHTLSSCCCLCACLASEDSDICPYYTPEPIFWNHDHSRTLVSYLVKKILLENGYTVASSEYKDLVQDLMQRLEVVSEWDIEVDGDKLNIKEVSEAVYRDLCKGKSRRLVTHLVVTDMNRDEIIDLIYKHLVTPEEQRRTVGSILRSVFSSVRSAFCCWRR